MDSITPKISVIIACKNTAKWFERCLLSIKNQTFQDFEIIVVDNFSNDGTFEIAQKYADLVLQIGPERCTQFNLGFKHSKGEFIYRIGPDYELEADVLQKCMDKINQGFDALALHNRSVGGSIWAKVRYLERESYRNSNEIVAVRFMKASVFKSAGMFDENLVANEDFDLHKRIENAGFKWSHVDAIENHLGEPENILEVWNKFYYYGRTIGRYMKKNQDTSKKHITLFRPSFKKFYFELFKTPKLLLAFHVYFLVKGLAGICGLLVGTPKNLKS